MIPSSEEVGRVSPCISLTSMLAAEKVVRGSAATRDPCQISKGRTGSIKSKDC